MYTYHAQLRAQLLDTPSLPLSLRTQPAFGQLLRQLLELADLLLFIDRATAATNTRGAYAVLDTMQFEAGNRLRTAFTILDGLITAHEFGMLTEEWNQRSVQAWLHETRRVIALAAYGVIHHPQALPTVVAWLDHIWN